MARILVVDDSPTIASTVQWLLRDLGHTVQIEEDGLGTLSALQTFNPDLVLLDIRLPSINGYELLALIRQKTRFADLPIVMMSGLTAEADIQQALNFGADEYITKPINDDALIAVIERQLVR